VKRKEVRRLLFPPSPAGAGEGQGEGHLNDRKFTTSLATSARAKKKGSQAYAGVVSGNLDCRWAYGVSTTAGIAEIETPLGLPQGSVVEIRRLDVFDNNAIRFATLGVRIQNPLP
jgi:hypothetical protein